jgi:hypothetical protein
MRLTLTSPTSRPCSPSRRSTGSRAAAALLAGAFMLAAPQAAQAACMTRLPAKVSLPDGPYAAAYTKQIAVRVSSRGPRIRNLRAELYTFSGQRLAVSPPRRAMRVATTLKLRLDDVFGPLQVGGFTLVLTGEPNRDRSCGPKKTTRILRFSACSDKLPVTFPDLPGGHASDYGGFLSVPIRSNGPLIRDLRSSVYGFDGQLIGRAPSLGALFGQQMLDHALTQPLLPGRYNVITEGLIGDQPRSCGRAKAEAAMTFE